MDEMLKLYLDKIETSINELKGINKLQIDHVNGKINELKDVVEKLRTKVEEIQIEYVNSEDVEKFVTKDYCNNHCSNEMSTKKITLLCGAISTICITLVELIKKI